MQDERSGAQLYLRFADVVQQFLSVSLSYKTSIPYDQQLKQSNRLQRLIIRQDAKSTSSQAITLLCEQIVSQNQIATSAGNTVKGLDMIFRPTSGHA